jgi:glycosyltransferase involved in cell wall biosynthesis
MNIDLAHKIPILIPVYGNVDYTKKCIASLLRHTDPNLFECLIIDNGSTDDTPQYLQELVAKKPENFRAIRLETNLGFGGGLNKGFELIRSFKWEYCVVANNDLLFTPNWLAQMLTAMTTFPAPRVGIVGPMSNFAGGSQGMNANYRTSEDLEKFAVAHSELNKGQMHEAGVVVGLLMLMKREFIDEVGVFDERFFPGTWEENDLELRGALKGWRYVVDRSTFIHHYGSKTIATVESSKDQRKNFVTNRTRFRDKWKSVESPWEDLARERYVLRGQDPEKFKKENGCYRKWVVAACRVKDGAQWMDRTLSRVSEFADEIVILVDQATTDNTEDICRRFPKVVSLAKEPPHEYNEAWSRNRVLQMAFDRNPDWVYCFDADEVIERRAVDRRDELTDPEDPSIMLWVQPIIQLWNTENTQRVDGLWGNFYQGRMFRVLPGQKIDNSNNLIHSGSTPFTPSDRHGFSHFRILHYGNVDASIRDKKYDWYTKTDTQKDLNMALGGYKEHYWKLYYGQPRPEERQAFDGKWKVIPEDGEWKRPPFGAFNARDVYRHVKDETGLVLIPFDEKPTISVCMLVKNEAGLLPRAISSIRAFVQEIIVVDTGSVDGSDHVAEALGAKVYNFDWKDDFSAARNFSLSKATGDWILRIDPDETVPWETAIRLSHLVRDQGMEGYVFPIMNFLQEPSSTPNAQWALSETCRLYKNLYPTVHYRNPVHEELDDSFRHLADKRKREMMDSGVPEATAHEQSKIKVGKVNTPFHHFGYLRGREFLDQKFDYYFRLGEKQKELHPDDPRPYFNQAVHYTHLGRYSDALKSYEKTLELDPRNHMALNDCGYIYLAVKHDPEKAEQFFKKSLSLMDETTHQHHRDKVSRNLEEAKLQILSKLLRVI